MNRITILEHERKVCLKRLEHCSRKIKEGLLATLKDIEESLEWEANKEYSVMCLDDFEGSYAVFKIKGDKIFKSENYSPFEPSTKEEYQWYLRHSSRIQNI